MKKPDEKCQELTPRVDPLVMCCANCSYWGECALDIDYAWHYCENQSMSMIIATAPDEKCEGFSFRT